MLVYLWTQASKSRRYSTDENNLAVKRFKNCAIMYCWGSTIHGELGLGGIEDENIFMPREVDFAEANDIVQSEETVERF